jgi:hypothetical protein
VSSSDLDLGRGVMVGKKLIKEIDDRVKYMIILIKEGDYDICGT